MKMAGGGLWGEIPGPRQRNLTEDLIRRRFLGTKNPPPYETEHNGMRIKKPEQACIACSGFETEMDSRLAARQRARDGWELSFHSGLEMVQILLVRVGHGAVEVFQHGGAPGTFLHGLIAVPHRLGHLALAHVGAGYLDALS